MEEGHNCTFMDFKIWHQANKGMLDRLETILMKKAISDNSIKLVKDITFIFQSLTYAIFSLPPP